MPTASSQTDQSLRVTEAGFIAIHRGAEREFHDDEVIGVEIHREHSSRLQATVETLRVRIADQNDTALFEIESQYSGPDDDFAAPFRERLFQSLLERTMETLHRGDVFNAGPWTISLEGIQDNQTGQRIPIEEISVAEWRDGHFWIRGEGCESAGFATHAENTHLLPWVLQYLMPEGTAPQTLSHSATGRTLAEFRDVPQGVAMTVGIGAGVGIAVAVGLLRFAPVDAMTGYAILGGILLVAAAVLGTVHFLYGKAVLLRHLDDALVRIHGQKEQVLPLDRLAGFAANWTDIYVNSVYSGTTVRFEFETDCPEMPRMVHHSDAKHGQPKYEELQKFQARIAAKVAERMKEEVGCRGRVAWTPRLTILPNGLEFRKKASAEPTFYDFTQISRCEVDQGLLKLAVDGDKRPTIVEKCDQMNFFPGFALVQRLAGSESSDSTHGSKVRV